MYMRILSCVYVYIIRNNVNRSRGAKSFILLGTLLNANPAVVKYNDSYELLYCAKAGFASKSV
jgi:hypothetical protein